MSNLLARELKRSKYRLLGLVGQGQFGKVYCAIHRKTGRLVALKDLDRQRFPTHKFLRELRFLLSLQHPNIVTCQALEHTATGRYLVMDYCEGGTLRSLVDEEISLHPQQSLKLVADVLAGLDHAHSRGIVHCDIKPENILLAVQRGGWVARISDFGIARLSQELRSEGANNTGSPAYMAPERFYGQYSPASDIYAVGILLFELLAGYRPFSGAPADLMSAHLNQPLKIPPSIPVALQAVIAKALQKLPGRRFRSAAEMLTALQTAALESVELYLSQDWPTATLLRPTTTSPVCAFQSLRQESLQTPVQQLLTGSTTGGGSFPPHALTVVNVTGNGQVEGRQTERIYWVSEQQVGCHCYADRILLSHGIAGRGNPELPAIVTVTLPDPIQELIIRPQGGFAITARSIYWLSPAFWQSEPDQHGQGQLPPARPDAAMPQSICDFTTPFLTAIDPTGCWMATTTLAPESVDRSLSLWNLHSLQSLTPIKHCPIPSEVRRQATPPFQLMALDHRHLAMLAHLKHRSADSLDGLLLQGFTRRGHSIGSLSIPMPLHQLTPTTTPYQVLAIEPGALTSVVLVDFKPLRIQRLGVTIPPKLITVATWGYIFMAETGRIVLLNRYGQMIGQVDGPPHPTAIALLPPYGLVIATWHQGQGNLYTVDLRQLELDILF
ncbi:serine/threonine-protein kinase [Pantanalinema rosaneae CENA516]|uniref:serine/threonine-protein kinase n=1 Tax=Pantanalinema rosaneae TaxID=1620701 RepID=UPI003D6EFCC8